MFTIKSVIKKYIYSSGRHNLFLPKCIIQNLYFVVEFLGVFTEQANPKSNKILASFNVNTLNNQLEQKLIYFLVLRRFVRFFHQNLIVFLQYRSLFLPGFEKMDPE